MSDLDKAREWADNHRNISDHRLTARVKAAAEVIQSLPDQWVDVEKVRDLIDLYKYARDANESGSEGWAINDLVVANLEGLLAPKLPTLADMTAEERKACKWMQADVELLASESSVTCVIADPRTSGAKVRVWASHGGSDDIEEGRVTPLPDLPKLKWPGGVVDCEIVDEPEATNSSSIHTTMQPSEVPPNEPWLIEVSGQKAIGTRYKGDAVLPWFVAALDGSFADDYHDNAVTLIHKLVPETHTLPEGMRLADHEEYGRVVFAPRANTHGEESFYRTNEDSAWGASHGYRPTEQFTFLDGEA